jgi:hypothetical protein
LLGILSRICNQADPGQGKQYRVEISDPTGDAGTSFALPFAEKDIETFP